MLIRESTGRQPKMLVTLLLGAFSVANLWFAYRVFSPSWYPSNRFSFQGSDFPDTMPIPTSRNIQMVFNSSDHLPLMGMKSDGQWASLTSQSWGNAQLGSTARLFGSSMFHEVHCLRILNLAFGLHPIATIEHVNHCLGYLRLMALCAADTTLEIGDFTTKGDSGFWSPEATYTCADTDVIYKWMENNYGHWEKFDDTKHIVI